MDKFATNPISQTYRKMEHTRPWGLICKYMNRQHIRRYPHTRNYHSRSQSCRSKARWLRKRARFETFRCIGERFQAGGWEGGGRRRPLYTTKPSVVAWGRGVGECAYRYQPKTHPMKSGHVPKPNASKRNFLSLKGGHCHSGGKTVDIFDGAWYHVAWYISPMG